MDRGWVKLWRKSLDSGIFRNPDLWFLWCWCLMKASRKHVALTIGQQLVDLKPGEFVTGRKKAAEELGMSLPEVVL